MLCLQTLQARSHSRRETLTLRKTHSPGRAWTILLGLGHGALPNDSFLGFPEAGHPGTWHSKQASVPFTAQWVLERSEEWAFLASERKPQESDKHQPPASTSLLGLIPEAPACPLTARPGPVCSEKYRCSLEAAAAFLRRAAAIITRRPPPRPGAHQLLSAAQTPTTLS